MAGGSGCAGCAAAHPIFAPFLCKDPNFWPKKLHVYTYLHTQCLDASTALNSCVCKEVIQNWNMFNLITEIKFDNFLTKKWCHSKICILQSLFVSLYAYYRDHILYCKFSIIGSSGLASGGPPRISS